MTADATRLLFEEILAEFGNLKSLETADAMSRSADALQMRVMRVYREAAHGGIVPRLIDPIPPEQNGRELLDHWSALAGHLAQVFPGSVALREDIGTLVQRPDGKPVFITFFPTPTPSPAQMRDWNIGWIGFAESVMRTLIKQLLPPMPIGDNWTVATDASLVIDISKPDISKLAKDGRIPSRKVGKNLLVDANALVKIKRQRDAQGDE